MRIKLLTFNIHGWLTMADQHNLTLVEQVIRDSGADIVGLNEVFHPDFHPDHDPAKRPDSQDAHSVRRPQPQTQNDNSGASLELLARRLDMHFVFGPCMRWPAQDEMPERSYGNALLSRWPIVASAAHHLTPVEGKEQRGLLEGRIQLPDRSTLTVYVTHLDHTDESARMIQLRAVRAWTVRDRNRPHVLMGDFNAIHPWDYEHRPVDLEEVARHPDAGHMLGEDGPEVIPQLEKIGYTDAFRHCSHPGQGTFIPALPPVRLDYVWVSEPLTSSLQAVQVWQEPVGQEASDHRPVLVEIDL